MLPWNVANLASSRRKKSPHNREFSESRVASFEVAWLGRKGSNLRMAEPEPAAFPLGYAPMRVSLNPCFFLVRVGVLVGPEGVEPSPPRVRTERANH